MTNSDIEYFVDKIDELLNEMEQHEQELYVVIELAHNLRDELKSISTIEDGEAE